MDEEFELKKITIQSYSDNSILLNNKYSKSCPQVVQALTTKDTAELKRYWKAFVKEQGLHNASPERVLQRLNNKDHIEERLLWAKVDLTTYGWFICANGQTNQVNRDYNFENEFSKLFMSVKFVCDEP